MAFEGYLVYDGVEVANIARTWLLARTLGVTGVRIKPSDGNTLLTRLGGDASWGEVEEAPWYDPAYPASGEFAGILPLSMQGLDDSSLQAEVTEYTTDGGSIGSRRNATQVIVGNVIFVASTERGVEFGMRWLAHVLRDGDDSITCSGADLHYLRTLSPDAEMVHRRNVGLTRSFSITRKKRNSCSTAWWVTFTLTDADGYEYGDEVPKITSLGQAGAATGVGVTNSGGVLTPLQIDCPVYDYSPIYDPLYPALVAPPAIPDFLPDGWGIEAGMKFQRRWCRITSTRPVSLMSVPKFKVTSTVVARMIRVSIFPSLAANDAQCDPLFSVVISYLPANLALYIDGEAKAAYFWDGASPTVRRADTVVFSPAAEPVEWASFNDGDGTFLVTLDAMEVTPGSNTYQGGGNVRAALSLIPKSD